MICLKCGGDKISTTYHTDAYIPNGCGYASFNKRENEHLHKNCQNCGYDWCEDIYKLDSLKGRKDGEKSPSHPGK